MKIKDITRFLESIAPTAYQESYDNAGLIVGHPDWDCTGALLCLDSVEKVIDEAIQNNCNLIIAHHPIVFSGLKSITGKNYIERTIIKAIKHDIAIYAAHTNLDNIKMGVNQKICDRLGLVNCEILAPKKDLMRKLSTICPLKNAEEVRQAMLASGAGGLDEFNASSFNTLGLSTTPKTKKIRLAGEMKIEVIYPAWQEAAVLDSLMKSHPHTQPLYDIVSLNNTYHQVGSGMVGNLKEATNGYDFLKMLKRKMKTDTIKHTSMLRRKIRRVAVCGGAGSFLLGHAIRQKADLFITSDYKYHQFFDAEGKIIIADIGHYESEQFTVELFYEFLTKKFTTFAVVLSKVNTNPVKYL